MDALKKELRIRGLSLVEESDSSDAIIAIFIVIEEETGTADYKLHMEKIGCRPSWGWVTGACIKCEVYNEFDYVKGTIVLDVYDCSNRSLLWQGVNARILKDHPAKREKTIPKHVGKMMKQFPIKPGL